MANNNNNLGRKLELAILNSVKLNYDTIPGHIGFTDDELARPHYTIASTSMREMIYKSGTMAVTVDVMVKSDADLKSEDGAPLDHHDRVGEVFDTILTDPPSAFITTMNTDGGVDDFTAFVLSERERINQLEERAFVSILRLEIICCGSDIS